VDVVSGRGADNALVHASTAVSAGVTAQGHACRRANVDINARSGMWIVIPSREARDRDHPEREPDP